MKIFKILCSTLFFVSPVFFALSSCTCSKNDKDPDPKPEKQQLKTIKISCETTNIILNLNDDEYISQQIIVKCFDQKNKEFSHPTSLEIIGEKIKWIWLDENNKIHIAKNKIEGEYKIQLKASDLDKKIISNFLTINISVKKSQEPIIPDQIEILMEQKNQYVFINFPNNFQLYIKPSKKGYDSSQLSKECEWSISNVIGPKIHDLDSEDLFTIKDDLLDKKTLCISSRTSLDYIGQYRLTISAHLNVNPHIKTTKILILDFVDGFNYVLPDKSATFARDIINSNWQLYSGVQTTNPSSFENMTIYGKDIDTISDYYSSRYNKSLLCEYNLGKKIKKIGHHALENEKGILYLIADNVEIFGDYALSGSTFFQLKSQSPLKWVEIGKYAFKNCFGFTKANIPNIKIIKDYAFFNSGLQEIELGENIREIGIGAFDKCIDLKIIKIRAFVPPKLYGTIFGQCPANLEILVPNSVMVDYLNNEQWRVYKNNIKGY